MKFIIENWFLDIIYLVSFLLFTFGLKRLSHPRTARNGNLLSASGMLIAIIATLLDKDILNYELILTGILLGSMIGIFSAKKIEMTAMPQMVAIFNGFGGAASALVTFAQYSQNASQIQGNLLIYIALILSVLIGSVTFSGSIVAFQKLQGWLSGNPIIYPLQKILSLLMFSCLIWLSIYQFNSGNYLLYICLISLFLGINLVVPIGGADMPVVVSLLNSYSGLAVAMSGFVLSNNVLIVVGSLVGASGIILTRIMCKAMNRSLLNVLFGGFGGEGGSVQENNTGVQKNVKSYSPEEAAMILEVAEKVVFIPGYGMAVSQAQHATKKLASKLMQKGVDVKFAIHPVAGRMPGHMNVLLAESGIDYDQLYDMDKINNEFKSVDVSVVIGANDVVNPAAKEDTSSPIYGMPVLNVEHSKSVFVLKRSLNPGFAGIENDLFYRENTLMIFGDAKETLENLIEALEE